MTKAKVAQKFRLVFDLDELLVHSYFVSTYNKRNWNREELLSLKAPKKKVIRDPDYGATLTRMRGNVEWKVKTVKRPGLQKFFDNLVSLKQTIETQGVLEQLGLEKELEIVFWTASTKIYADIVLDEILPDALKGSQRLYREHCAVKTVQKGQTVHYKDVTKQFEEQDLRYVLMFDDSSRNLEAIPSNGILCHRWLGDMTREPGEPRFYLDLIYHALEELFMTKIRAVSERGQAFDVRNHSREMECSLREQVKSSGMIEDATAEKTLRGYLSFTMTKSAKKKMKQQNKNKRREKTGSAPCSSEMEMGSSEPAPAPERMSILSFSSSFGPLFKSGKADI